MDPRAEVLALVLAELELPRERLRDFDGRRVLQKVVYLLQEGRRRWDFGFSYNLYIRGPYSPELAGVGYDLLTSQELQTQTNLVEECRKDISRLRECFAEADRQLKLNADLLELAATLHFLCRHSFSYLGQTERLDEAKRWLKQKKPGLVWRLDDAVAKLESLGMLN